MSRYAAYTEYKDSGVHWLGEIPIEWEVSPIKRVALIFNGATPKSTEETFWDGDIPWVTPADLGKERSPYIHVGSRSITQLGYESCGTSIVPVGTIILAARAPIGTLGIAASEMCTNQGCKALVVKRIYNKFLYYVLLSSKTQLNLLGRGTTFLELSADELGGYKIAVPSSEIQKKIANFLDHETAKIDTLIAKQQELIKLLKEKRQAVISNAVTKGLNPNGPMRDSGVEWLGEVPAHWDVVAVSKIAQKITNGYVGPTRDILVEDGVPYVQATHIKKGIVNFDGAYFVRENWSQQHAKSILIEGDVLIVQTGAGTGDVGLVSKNEEGFNCHALIIVQPKKEIMYGNFLSLTLQSQYGTSVLFSLRTGGMHPHLNCGEVQFMKVPVPPVNEQVTIVDFVYRESLRFDSLIERAECAIQLMQERRTALISAAVTGKIDVRDVKVSEKELIA
jgi:type I restriction enzyme S subunit